MVVVGGTVQLADGAAVYGDVGRAGEGVGGNPLDMRKADDLLECARVDGDVRIFICRQIARCRCKIAADGIQEFGGVALFADRLKPLAEGQLAEASRDVGILGIGRDRHRGKGCRAAEQICRFVGKMQRSAALPIIPAAVHGGDGDGFVVGGRIVARDRIHNLAPRVQHISVGQNDRAARIADLIDCPRQGLERRIAAAVAAVAAAGRADKHDLFLRRLIRKCCDGKRKDRKQHKQDARRAQSRFLCKSHGSLRDCSFGCTAHTARRVSSSDRR